MSPSAGGLVVFLLSVQVIQSQDGWRVNYRQTDVCAAKGSTVYISCYYTYPPGIDPSDIKDRFWFTKEKDGEPVDLKTDSEYSGRVTYRCYSNSRSCYLLITDVRESDSAEYKFTFMTNKPGEKYTGSPGVTLSVTGFQVQVRRSDSTWLELTCHSSCVLSDRAEYYWYKNEEYIKRGSSLSVSSGSTDRYYCYLRGSYSQRSPAVYGPQRPSVSVSPSAEMLEGDSVTLTCSADANPAASYTWYKEHEDSPRASGQIFTITNFTAEHSGNYYCEAQNEMGRSNSTIRLIPSSVIQSQDGWRVIYYPTYVCAAKGSTVDISSFYTHPPRIRSSDIKDRFWFTKEKDGEPVDLRTDSEYSDRVTYGCYSNSKDCYLTITDVRESDSAEYKFRFMTEKMGGKYTGSPGVTLSVTGLQVQVRRLNSTWLELTCHSSCVLSRRPEYDWYKNEENIKTGSSLPVSSGSTDRYSCYLRRSWNQRSPAVYGPQRPSVSVSPSAEMLEGDSVTLTCSTDANPAASYTWYKEHEDSPRASGQIFTITDFTAEHSGNYYCEAQNEMGRSNSTLRLIPSSEKGGSTWSTTTTVFASISAVFLLIIILAVLYIR
uniref:Ig-like domain-containing protein n=1 Tax=Gasterosteus aculeatus aculeatus TaxID=481459 RepID=A0AAQ4S0A4_GASAC